MIGLLRNPQAWSPSNPILLSILTFTFGLQMLRLLIVELVYYLREVKDLSTLFLGGIAFAVFFTVFLAPIIRRCIGIKSSFALTAFTLGLVRLVEQFIYSSPADLCLAIIGTVLFLWFFPISLHHFRSRGPEGGVSWVLALFLGISVDTAAKGVFGTLDVTWYAGFSADLVTIILFAGQLLLITPLVRGSFTMSASPETDPQPTLTPGSSFLPLISIGSILLLDLLLFQNIGQQTVLIDWPQPAVYTWIVAANLFGVVGILVLTRLDRPVPSLIKLFLGVLLVLAVVGERSGIQAALVVLFGQLALALLLVPIVTSAEKRAGSSYDSRLDLGVGLGLILFVTLVFLFYVAFDIGLPFPREVIPPVAAGVLALAGIWSRGKSWIKSEWPRIRWAVLVPLALLVLPPVYFVGWNDASVTQGNGLPVRVMAYNLHAGFDVEGRLVMEDLAKVIEAEDPDIIALQEVSRGWLINDAVDMLDWLSQRLDMKYVSGPTADSLWGNALLSRYPIVGSETHDMPNNSDITIDRGFILAEVDVGDDLPLRIIATHLHAGEDEGEHRIPQSKALVDFWNGVSNTIMLGDFNGRPWDPEITLLEDAGLKDAFIASGAEGKGFTSASDSPHQRIDYIWVSPDLQVSDFSIPQSQASDHFPIAVTIFR